MQHTNCVFHHYGALITEICNWSKCQVRFPLRWYVNPLTDIGPLFLANTTTVVFILFLLCTRLSKKDQKIHFPHLIASLNWCPECSNAYWVHGNYFVALALNMLSNTRQHQSKHAISIISYIHSYISMLSTMKAVKHHTKVHVKRRDTTG